MSRSIKTAPPTRLEPVLPVEPKPQTATIISKDEIDALYALFLRLESVAEFLDVERDQRCVIVRGTLEPIRYDLVDIIDGLETRLQQGGTR